MINDSWKNLRYCVVDLEGTGAQDKENEAILEISAVHIVDGVVQNNYFHSLINPERKIPKRPWIKLTNEDLIDAPVFQEIRDDLFSYMKKSVFVAHNARVDWRLVSRKYPNFQPIILDTLALSRKLYPKFKKHGLDELIERFNLHMIARKIDGNRHRAHFDAILTAYALVEMINENFTEETTLEELTLIGGIDRSQKQKNTETKTDTDTDRVQGSLF